MIYFTFIGNHDKITSGQPFGAALTIFLQYKSLMDQVYIFVNPSKPNDDINYTEIAQNNKSVMEQETPDLKVVIIELELHNPIDYDLVYPAMLHEVQNIMEDETIEKAEKIINITSGTPTMTACWVLLHKSGLIPNSKIVQSFETKFARIEYINNDCFNLSYMRHTEQWWEIYTDLSIDECLKAIREEPHFLP